MWNQPYQQQFCIIFHCFMDKRHKDVSGWHATYKRNVHEVGNLMIGGYVFIANNKTSDKSICFFFWWTIHGIVHQIFHNLYNISHIERQKSTNKTEHPNK